MMLTLCVVFITTQNCSFLICILISCHWKSVYSWLIIVVRSSTHFHFIPYTFCLYVILTSSFLQGSLCAPSNSTGRHFINLSLPMCGFSIPVIMFETNLCLFPPSFLPCVTAAGCRLPAGEELIFFSSIFCSFPCSCLLLGWFSATSPGREGSIPASQGYFLQLNTIGSYACSILKVPLCSAFGRDRVSFLHSTWHGVVFSLVLETIWKHWDVFVTAQQCWHRVKVFSAPHPPHQWRGWGCTRRWERTQLG